MKYMKKIIIILLLIFSIQKSFADTDDILLDCRKTSVDGKDYWKNTFIYWWWNASYVWDTLNYNDFLADEEGNIYQILWDLGKMYIKINDKTSPQYNYIYNEMPDIDVRNGRVLFKVYDINKKQFLVYFDGESFSQTESFDNIYKYELSWDWEKYALLVIQWDNERELYLNNKLIDSWMVTDEFVFSKNGESFSYVKLSGVQKESATPWKYYLPDVELYKDFELLKTFKNSSYHSWSMRYFGDTDSIGLAVIPDNTEPNLDKFIFTRDGVSYNLPTEMVYLKNVVYNNSGSQFYTKVSSTDNLWTSYVTDGKTKSNQFDTIESIKINPNNQKVLFLAFRRNTLTPIIENRYLVYDWKEIQDTSSLVKKYEKWVEEANDPWGTDFYINYIGSFFWDGDNFYSIDTANYEKTSDIEYYINRGTWEHQKLEIWKPYQGKVWIFKKSFWYFIKNEETKGGTYYSCTVIENSKKSLSDSDQQIENNVVPLKANSSVTDFESVIKSKFDTIDKKLTPQKRIDLYKKLRTSIENLPKEKMNYKFEFLLELSRKHYNKAVKSFILK